MLQQQHCYVGPADLPAPVRDVGCSRKNLYFLRPSWWCQTASGRLIPQPCTQNQFRNCHAKIPFLGLMVVEYTLQCRWCAVCPSVLLLLTVEVRLTSSSSGRMWLLTTGGCVFLLSAGTWKFSSITEKKQIKLKQTSRCIITHLAMRGCTCILFKITQQVSTDLIWG